MAPITEYLGVFAPAFSLAGAALGLATSEAEGRAVVDDMARWAGVGAIVGTASGILAYLVETAYASGS